MSSDGEDAVRQLVADTANNRVRKLCADAVGCTIGFIYTVAGLVDPAAAQEFSR